MLSTQKVQGKGRCAKHGAKWMWVNSRQRGEVGITEPSRVRLSKPQLEQHLIEAATFINSLTKWWSPLVQSTLKCKGGGDAKHRAKWNSRWRGEMRSIKSAREGEV